MKKIQVTESTLPTYEDYIEEIKDLWNSKWLTNMGSKHSSLEVKLEEYLNVKNVNLFTNGHLALESVLDSLDLQGEVITTPFTFSSTTHAIVRNGLTPVFCDIKESDYTIDETKIEALITDKTSAIVPVHVYGNICNVEEIERIADRYNLKVIYDAAHAFGITFKGIGIGNYGDASMFSFHATKVYNTIEGGAVTFQDSMLNEKLNSLKNFGMGSDGEIELVGSNAKMNEFQAAMGICNLKDIELRIEEREKIVEQYNKLLEGTPGIKINQSQDHVKNNYSYYPVVFDQYKKTRDEVLEELAEENIYARKYFYPLTSDFKVYRNEYKGHTPIARSIASKVLTLPLHPFLTQEDINTICSIILK
ncbi:MAG: DegT/DnrJ/EryC1/StrS family aminotransferase [Alkalibacterium sp.]|nr:DegT/DnrJ/EryC1/StrS family aminotransferase [Alkalibacterium sp.]